MNLSAKGEGEVQPRSCLVAIAQEIFVLWSVLEHHRSQEAVRTRNKDYGETCAISFKSRR